MAEFKMTKNALRDQEHRLEQLQTYLPTLELKKTLLQIEINHTKHKIEALKHDFDKLEEYIFAFSNLLSETFDIDPLIFTKLKHVEKKYENIAGLELPEFQKVIFVESDYQLYDTPPWFDSVIEKIKELIVLRERINVNEEKKRALEKELRDVSIRVNLFDKVLIPRTIRNVKKIKIFLSDQELAAVSQAKVAKRKILLKRSMS